MNEVGKFAGVERHHHFGANLPGFHRFLNGNACTSNVVIHLNGTGESIMQQSSGIGLPTDTSQPASLGRKRKRSSAGDTTFKCSFCPKKFSNQSLLNAHSQECQLTRTHVCDLCGKRFKAKGGLQQHQRTHLQDEDRPYQCSYCSKRFNQKSHVDQHERIHTGDKPFLCQFCGRGFRQRSQQIGHETTHTGGGNTSSSGLGQMVGSSHPATMVSTSHLLGTSAQSSFSSDQSSGETTPSYHNSFLTPTNHAFIGYRLPEQLARGC